MYPVFANLYYRYELWIQIPHRHLYDRERLT